MWEEYSNDYWSDANGLNLTDSDSDFLDDIWGSVGGGHNDSEIILVNYDDDELPF